MKEKSRQLRDSNYELLRIICMIFIVTWHVIQHGHVIENTTGVANLIFNMVMLFIVVHVNSYMLITGYYQSKSRFHLNKFIKFLLQIWFYNFLIVAILSGFGLIKVGYGDFLLYSSLFDFRSHWYFRCFIIIYLLSPFLNHYIEQADRKELKNIILVLLFCFSICPYFTGGLTYLSDGLNLSQYLLMYFVGAYIRKYDLCNTNLSKFNLSQRRTIYLLTFFGCWFVNISIYYFCSFLGTIDNEICHIISLRLGMFKYFYSNPITIIQSIAFYLLFGTFNFKNKLVNMLSSLMLGIYLIHENEFIKNNLFKWIGIYSEKTVYGNYIIVRVITWALIIFMSCAFIETIRILIFFIFSKLKPVKKISNNLQKYLNSMYELH